MTLKQAILKLPQLDKRWETVKGDGKSFWMINPQGDEWMVDEYITIDHLIAAAHTIAMVIWFNPEYYGDVLIFRGTYRGWFSI